MLDSIQVKNVALIDEAEVEFESGLNILTGETGAGKSILLSSVQLALGAKADKGLIRQGAEYASVTLTFSPNEDQIQKLNALDIMCEDELIVLQRRIYPGKSICKINGETVVLKTMQSVAEVLIDIHGQREHQAVLKKSVQEEMLDNYCMDLMVDDFKKIRELYTQIKESEKLLAELKTQDGNGERELDFAKFELDEIVSAQLKPGEDIALEEQFERLSNAQKIEGAVYQTKELLNGNEQGVQNALSVALHELMTVKDMDEQLADAYSQISDAQILLQDCGHFLDRYLDAFQSGMEDLETVTERLNLINRLKNKHGNDIESILNYADRLSEKIEQIENREQYLINQEEKLNKLRLDYYNLAKKLHEVRVVRAKELSECMEKALQDLNFEQCKFEVVCSFQEDLIKKNGCSEIAFMISMNKGEALKSLTDVASGGELSRIMLAFKAVFADKDKMQTLVFDEIDSGISGKTAWKVSEKLAVLRKDHQVICITHLPQIAVMADVHFCIEKKSVGESTKTSVEKLGEGESVAEIGRLLGTDQLTDAVLQNALEMKKMARETKQY